MTKISTKESNDMLCTYYDVLTTTVMTPVFLTLHNTLSDSVYRNCGVYYLQSMIEHLILMISRMMLSLTKIKKLSSYYCISSNRGLDLYFIFWTRPETREAFILAAIINLTTFILKSLTVTC